MVGFGSSINHVNSSNSRGTTTKMVAGGVAAASGIAHVKSGASVRCPSSMVSTCLRVSIMFLCVYFVSGLCVSDVFGYHRRMAYSGSIAKWCW